MTVKITTANGGSDSLDFGCAQTAIVATVTGTEVSSGEGKLELKTTTGGTSAAKMTIAANGTVTLAAPLPVASGGTGSTTGAIYLQTAVATTSGTEIDFTSIPAGVKRINVLFNEVSTNGSSIVLIRLGDSGGIETSGYICNSWTANTNNTASTAGFLLGGSGGGTWERSGIATISTISSNRWQFAYAGSAGSAGGAEVAGGTKATSATLDRLQITTVNGSDVFDAGSVNISWEF
jgi:hypothetical protein